MMKTKHYILLLLVSISVFSTAARRVFTAGDLVGTWKYLISDVPEQYQTGSLVFEQKENKTVGYVESAQKSEMEGLTVDRNTITFTTENQSGVFKYRFTQKGDTLMGMIASQYGDFAITAIRQAK
jgi:hypothetical protein